MQNWKDLYERSKIVNDDKGFDGKYSVLSNFYTLCHPIVLELPLTSTFGDEPQKKYEFYTAEAAFQACKTLDAEMIEKISKSSPGKAKRLGRKVELRTDWESIKDQVMKDILFSKVAVCPEFKKMLKNIPEDMYIVEMNYWHDTYWGVCSKTFQGRNKLGEILMEIRGLLQCQK